MPDLKTAIGYSVILIAAITAQASLLVLALFLFYGSFELVNLGMGAAESLIFDTFLSALFFIQHSIMVRQGFRRWLAKLIPRQFYGAFFTIASAMVLLVIEITADRMLFNGMWTLWIIAGAFLEERDLADFFGEAYLRYKKKVPMLIPKSIRPAVRANAVKP